MIEACLWSELLLNFRFFKIRNHVCELDPQGEPLEYLGPSLRMVNMSLFFFVVIC